MTIIYSTLLVHDGSLLVWTAGRRNSSRKHQQRHENITLSNSERHTIHITTNKPNWQLEIKKL